MGTRWSASRLLVGVVFLLALFIPLAALAQEELTEKFTSEDETFAFSYPEGWEVRVDEETGFVILSDGDIELVFASPAAVGETIEGEASGDLNDTLLSFLGAFDIDSDEPVEAELEGREAIRAEVSSQDGPGTAFGLRFRDEGIGVVLVSGSEAAREEVEPTVMAIVATFDNPSLGLDVLGSIRAPQANCKVQTDEAEAVSVRVGPGTNRTSIVFLPADQEFTVLGKAQANDDTWWWKLDKAEVAPQSAANELWVAQDDVMTSGECDAVADAAAPPIIPIVVAKPPAEGEEVKPIVPGRGVWIMSFGGTVAVTCGGQTFSEPIPAEEEAVLVGVQEGGTVITLDGDPLNRTQPNLYSGQFDVPAEGQTFVAQITLVVVSTTRMEGTVSANIEGCNVTIPLTLTKS